MDMENEKQEPGASEARDGQLEPAEAEGSGLEAPAADDTEEMRPAERVSADGGDAEPEPMERETEAEPDGDETAATTEPTPVVAAPRKAAGKKTPKGKKTSPAAKKNTAGKATVAIDEVPAENKLPMKWYVIHTYSGHENKVKENILKMVKTSMIKDQFGRLIVPTEEVAEMKKGKKMITTRKFFPSYILIEMHMSEDSWHLVNGIPGVTSFVGAGTKPQPLSEPEVERILGRMDKDRGTITPEIPFTLGEHIRIKDGPFSDFTGIIDEINTEKGKLRVLVSIFGRETPVELDFLQVEPI